MAPFGRSAARCCPRNSSVRVRASGAPVDDRPLLIGILTEVIERFAGKLHCYSNVADSLQLLIQVGEEPLGRMMLRVARRYAHAVLGRLENSLAQTLPEAVDVVNRLFDMRFSSTCGACSSAPQRAAVLKH